MPGLNELRQSPIPLAALVAVMIACLLGAFHVRQRWAARWQQFLFAAMALFAAGGLGICLLTTAKKILAPPEWDFLCYWVFGQALHQGSPYNHELLKELASSLDVSPEFREELYCMYPLPCVLQFWPLGWFSPRAAAVAWYLLQWIAIGGVIYHAWRWLDARRSWTALLLTVALVCWWRSTRETLAFGQTTFWIAWVALVLLDNPVWSRSGSAVGLATFIKPLGGILLLPLVVQRQWRAVLFSAVPLLLSTAAFFVVQGNAGWQAYRTRPPLPDQVQEAFFKEPSNISLLAEILRWRGAPVGSQPLFYPDFLIAACLLTGLTLVTISRLPPRFHAGGVALSMVLGLLIYPGCLFHYNVCLLVPLCWMWREREHLLGGPYTQIVFIGIVYFLVGAQVPLVANAVAWCVLLIWLWSLKADATAENIEQATNVQLRSEQ